MRKLDLVGAREECLKLERLVLNSSNIDEYADYKETQLMHSPLYGCEESDGFVFMYAMCIDYLRDLKKERDVTLLNELYAVGPVPRYARK